MTAFQFLHRATRRSGSGKWQVPGTRRNPVRRGLAVNAGLCRGRKSQMYREKDVRLRSASPVVTQSNGRVSFIGNSDAERTPRITLARWASVTSASGNPRRGDRQKDDGRKCCQVECAKFILLVYKRLKPQPRNWGYVRFGQSIPEGTDGSEVTLSSEEFRRRLRKVPDTDKRYSCRLPPLSCWQRPVVEADLSKHGSAFRGTRLLSCLLSGRQRYPAEWEIICEWGRRNLI